MRSPKAVPTPTRRASEGTVCASATVLGQRPSLARWVDVGPGRIWPDFDAEAVRRNIQRGQPFGSVSWKAEVAAQLGLELLLRPRGRPRKSEVGSPTHSPPDSIPHLTSPALLPFPRGCDGFFISLATRIGPSEPPPGASWTRQIARAACLRQV